jgi:4Fe-4S ferredoxin
MMKVYRIDINKVLCTGCNDCVVSCPVNFDQLREKGFLGDKNAVILVKNGYANEIFNESRPINCTGCGVCVEICPQNAIKIKIEELID